MKQYLLALFGAFAGICMQSSAGNLAFNGSFEMGLAGFALERDSAAGKNFDAKFVPPELVPGAPGQGKNAIRIRNAKGELYSLFSKEFYLKEKTRYTVSCFLKSDKTKTGVFVSLFKVDPQWTADGKNFYPDTEWKPYQYTFTTRNAGYFHFHLRPANLQTPDRGDVFVDALRVEESAGESADKLEAAVVPGKTFFYRGEKAKLTLKCYNPGKTPVKRSVTVDMIDEYTKSTVWSKNFAIDLAPGNTAAFPLNKALDRYGAFRFIIRDRDVNSYDGFVPVFGKYTAKPFDITKDFVVGANGGLSFPSNKARPDTIHFFNAEYDRRFELLAAAGVRVLRDHDGGIRGVDWKSVQPDKGAFDFSFLDLQMRLYKKHDITLFPVIGNGHIVRKGSAFPKWAKLNKVQTAPPNCMTSVRDKIYMPDDAEYYRYLYETAKHLKGRIPVYEITNEPNLYLSPENYVHELKIAHDAIRKADPNAKISGFCLTSDFNAAATPWMQQCVKLGGLQYVDAIGFHPYRGRQLGSLVPADEYIAELRSEMKSYGKPDMPLWNTEVYYLADVTDKHYFSQGIYYPHHAATRFLLDLGEGAVQSISVHYNSLWKSMLTPNMRTGGNQHEVIPSENLVVYNTMARLFERARCVKKIRYANGVIGYVYRDQNGKLIAAVWSYLGKQGLRADFSAFQVMDLFGNEEKAEVKVLKDAPYYLTPGKLSEKEFMAKIQALPVFLDQPVAAGEIGRLAGGVLYVMLRNSSGEAQNVTLGLNSKGLIAKKIVKGRVPASGTLSLAIPVKVKNAAEKNAALVIQTRGNTVRQNITIVPVPAVKGTFEGKNFKGQLSFKDNLIKVKVTVQDATDAGPTGKRNAWDTDCVELFFDTDPLYIPEKFAHAYTRNTFRAFIMPRDKKISAFRGVDLKKCKYSVEKGENSYTAEFSMPAKTGKYLGFECKVDDYDESGKRVCETELGGRGPQLHGNRSFFAIAEEK